MLVQYTGKKKNYAPRKFFWLQYTGKKTILVKYTDKKNHSVLVHWQEKLFKNTILVQYTGKIHNFDSVHWQEKQFCSKNKNSGPVHWQEKKFWYITLARKAIMVQYTGKKTILL